MSNAVLFYNEVMHNKHL